MKKIYAALALAAFVSVSASAGLDKNVKAQQILNPNGECVMTKQVVAVNESSSKVMKAGTDYAKLMTGLKGWVGYNRLNGDDRPPTDYSTFDITIKPNNEVILMGYYFDLPLKGTYDPATGDITIASKQPLYYNTYYKEQVYFYAWGYELEQREDGKYYFVNEREVPNMVFKYCPNGVQYNDGTVDYEKCWVSMDNTMMFLSMESIKNQGSGFQCSYSNKICPLEFLYDGFGEFEYNPGEWEPATPAKLNDGWLRAWTETGQGFAPYDVKCKVNAKNKNIFLLCNPYGTGTPYESMNYTPNDNGYIYLDVTDPDCVVVRPFVYSGFSDQVEENDVDKTAKYRYFFATNEGVDYYMYQTSITDIKQMADFYGDVIGTMTADGLITLPNCRETGDYNARAYDQWVYYEEADTERENPIAIPMESQIKVDLTYAGINGVINDADNVATRYYNLQGVEISNPEDGQIVIAKNGKKAVKVVF